jgi:hypothetical protein
MFKNLLDFSRKRSGVEAFGFYLVYLIVGVLFGAITGGIVGVNASASKVGYIAGSITLIIFYGFLSLKIMRGKNLLSNFGAISLALLSVILSSIGSGLLGLIPVAVLSTFDDNS